MLAPFVETLSWARIVLLQIQFRGRNFMKLRLVCAVGLVALFASVAGAQTKVSGAQKCDKPEVVGTQEVTDKAGHTMSLVKYSCKWTTPMEMEGLKAKDGASVAFSDVTATRASADGTYVANMENGDKFFVSFRDSSAMKDGKPGAAKGTWSYTGGTGKLKGVTGKGTYGVTVNDDGTAAVSVEGEYTIAAPAMKKTAATTKKKASN